MKLGENIMKRNLTVLLAGIMTLSSAMSVNAAVYLNGTEVDDTTTIVNETVMVPVRKIVEGLDCEVDWDNDTKTVTFSRDSLKATLVIGERLISLYENDELSKQIVIDTPADLIDGKTMVPVRIVAETFDCDVVWNSENKNVTITSKSPVPKTFTEIDDEEERTITLVNEVAFGTDKAIGVLLKQYNQFSDEEKASFSEACDIISTILQRVESDSREPITIEEANGMLGSADDAYEILLGLASTHNLYEQFVDTANQYMEKYFLSYMANRK
jgi:copper amine oxidase domain protein